jgi:hypothetical protein
MKNLGVDFQKALGNLFQGFLHTKAKVNESESYHPIQGFQGHNVCTDRFRRNRRFH